MNILKIICCCCSNYNNQQYDKILSNDQTNNKTKLKNIVKKINIKNTNNDNMTKNYNAKTINNDNTKIKSNRNTETTNDNNETTNNNNKTTNNNNKTTNNINPIFDLSKLMEISNLQCDLLKNLTDYELQFDDKIYNYFITLGYFWKNHYFYYSNENLIEEQNICIENFDKWFFFLHKLGSVDKICSNKYTTALIKIQKLENEIDKYKKMNDNLLTLNETERIMNIHALFDNLKKPEFIAQKVISSDDSDDNDNNDNCYFDFGNRKSELV